LKRLYSLDALRGVAALSVVVWHWQHFFALSGTWQQNWQRPSQPLFWLLKPLYEAGWAAVDLFFALSGFVFFWLYREAIARGAVSGGRFALLRFSRLYPLHVVTLVLVAVLQIFFLQRTGHYFIFNSGDGVRFAAGLLMAQQWLPPTEDQFFNGPAWSVSIEVLLYILFFAFCRARLAGPRLTLAVALGGILIIPYNELIARGVMGFFLGGAVFFLTERIKARSDARRLARMIAGLALVAWLLVVAEDYSGLLHGFCERFFVSPQMKDYYLGASDDLFLLPFIFIVSPLTLMALALHEHFGGGGWRRLSFLGDISYSTYLLHFPMQLTLVLLALRFGLTPQSFQNIPAMAGFFAVLIALGALSHYRFERPMQAWIRSIYPRADRPALSPAPPD
jgi:peptidoglycan/LPS O-acetylase OafA/YrhL